MKLNKLSLLKNIDKLPIITKSSQNKKNLLKKMELILYTSNLCLFSTRIIRKEVHIKNKNETLSLINEEIKKTVWMLSTNNYINITKKDTRVFFKKVGLKPKHIKN